MTSRKSKHSLPPKGGLLAGLIWLSAALFYLYEYLIRVTPGVMEEELQVAFQATSGQLSGSFATYYYIYAPMQIVVGILFDRYGGKRLLVPATIIVALGCFISTLTTESLGLITLGRLLMGFGSAFGFVGALYLATVWYPENKIALLSGLTTALGMLGAIMGEALLSNIVDSVGWQASLNYSGIAGLLIAAFILIVIPKPPPWELDRRRKYKRTEKKEHSFLAGLKIVLSNKQTWFIGIAGTALFSILTVCADLWGIQYVMKVAQVKKSTAAAAISMLYLGFLIGAPCAGWLADRTGKRKVFLMGASFASAILFWTMLLFQFLPIKVFYFFFFVLGFISSCEVICFVSGIDANLKFLKGTAIAAVNMIVSLGGILQYIVGLLLDLQARSRSLEEYSSALTYTAQDYRFALMLIPIFLVIGGIACLFIKEKKHKSHLSLDSL